MPTCTGVRRGWWWCRHRAARCGCRPSTTACRRSGSRRCGCCRRRCWPRWWRCRPDRGGPVRGGAVAELAAPVAAPAPQRPVGADRAGVGVPRGDAGSRGCGERGVHRGTFGRTGGGRADRAGDGEHGACDACRRGDDGSHRKPPPGLRRTILKFTHVHVPPTTSKAGQRPAGSHWGDATIARLRRTTTPRLRRHRPAPGRESYNDRTVPARSGTACCTTVRQHAGSSAGRHRHSVLRVLVPVSDTERLTLMSVHTGLAADTAVRVDRLTRTYGAGPRRSTRWPASTWRSTGARSPR